jgi:hypothetical protein
VDLGVLRQRIGQQQAVLEHLEQLAEEVDDSCVGDSFGVQGIRVEGQPGASDAIMSRYWNASNAPMTVARMAESLTCGALDSYIPGHDCNAG